MSGQRPIDRYVRIRLTIIRKEYTKQHQCHMNDKAHKLWCSFSWEKKVEAMAELMSQLKVSKEKP